ncbi:MAG TPA: heme-binding protein [Phototrophicaceae bacterium]|nr:heme-binding protein [Phototrophicaceae bacterium]
MYQSYQLSHTDAAHIIEVIRQQLEQQHKGAAIAVVDAHGELMAFLRTDGCRLASINIAINKAFTASREQKESAALGQASRDKDFPLLYYGEIRYVGWGGGVPLVYEGQIVGGVGVSGLPETEDMVLAHLGATALAG